MGSWAGFDMGDSKNSIEFSNFLKTMNEQQIRQMEMFMKAQTEITTLKVEMQQTKRMIGKFQELYTSVEENKFKLRSIMDDIDPDFRQSERQNEIRTNRKQRYKDSATGGGVVGIIVTIVLALIEFFKSS
jgi:hypothetical protein